MLQISGETTPEHIADGRRAMAHAPACPPRQKRRIAVIYPDSEEDFDPAGISDDDTDESVASTPTPSLLLLSLFNIFHGGSSMLQVLLHANITQDFER